MSLNLVPRLLSEVHYLDPCEKTQVQYRRNIPPFYACAKKFHSTFFDVEIALGRRACAVRPPYQLSFHCSLTHIVIRNASKPKIEEDPSVPRFCTSLLDSQRTWPHDSSADTISNVLIDNNESPKCPRKTESFVAFIRWKQIQD